MSVLVADQRLDSSLPVNSEQTFAKEKWSWVKSHSRLIFGSLGGIIVLGGWQLAAVTKLVNVGIASDPVKVVHTLFTNGALYAALGVTGTEFAIGMLITLAAAIPLGLLFGKVTALYDMTEPLVNLFNSVPNVLFLPIMIFWFGIGTETRILIVIWSATLPLIINTTQGVRNIDSDYLRVARVCCAGKLLFYRSVLLPATLPSILTGIRQSVARALIAVIVAEFFLSGGGLGYFVQLASSNFQMTEAMAGVALMAVASVILTRLIGMAERHFNHWAQAQLN